MLMPFVRLLAIYILVGTSIFAFFKRDQLVAYFSTPKAVAIAAPQPTEVLEPRMEIIAQPSPAKVPATSTAPAFGAEITPQYFGQSAAPAAAPARPRGPGLVARWHKAREVFSQGSPADAAVLYEALTADFPRNADLHGEAGNLYYNLGQFSEATTHYFAVGVISARKGDMQMARNMMGVLRQIAPAKAAELGAVLSAGN